MLKKKKNFLKTNNITSLFGKKSKDLIPYVFPVAWIHLNKYENNSEKNRFEKISDLFLKLRVYLNDNIKNQLLITKEFLNKHGIYDRDYFQKDKLENFIKFIKSEECLKINPSKTINEIIIEAVFNSKNEEIDNNIDFQKISLKEDIFYKTSYSSTPKDLIHKWKKPFSPQSTKNIKKINLETNIDFLLEDKTDPNLYPILNEKNYKIKYDNPQMVIDNLEPEIAKIKGLSINSPQQVLLNYTRPLTRMKKAKIKNNGINISNIFSTIDLERIKKKNKLLEYIILERSKNILQLENNKKLYEFDYKTKK